MLVCVFEDNIIAKKYIWIVLLIFGILEIVNIFKVRKIYFNWPIICIFIFAIYCILSASWAIDYKISLVAGRSVLLLSTFLLFSYNYFRRIPNGLDKLLKTIAIVGIIFSIIVILYYNPIDYFQRLISGERVGADIANVNSIGMKVIVSFVVCVFYAIFKSEKKYYFLSIIPLIVSIGCGSRKTIFFAGISIIIMFLYYAFENNDRNIKKIVLLSLSFLIILIVGLYLLKVPFVVTQLDRIGRMINGIFGLGETDHSTMLRMSYINVGINQFYKTPILGIGIDNARLININSTYLHNNFVELLASVGIIGFLLYYIVYIIIFSNFIKKRKSFNDYYLICLCIIANTLVLDYGIVSYYSKTTYIYFLMSFLVLNIKSLELDLSKPIAFFEKVILKLMDLGFFNFMGDRTFIKFKYWLIFHKRLNLDNPKTFNEKLQWLKLNNYEETQTTMSDKYLAKEYVAKIIGEEYIIPTLGIYESFDEIDFKKLPNSFVIKCTHDSGGLVIVKNKKDFDINKARTKINKCLKKNYFYMGRETPYKYIKPRIIIEKFMSDNSSELKDYKFFCFSGKVELILVCSERSKNVKFTYFDKNGKFINVRQCGADNDPKVKLPKKINQMKKLAEKLSHDMIHVRVDFYEVNGKIYFGELTFFDSSGFGYFSPDKWDKKFGDMIVLPSKK